MCSVVLTGCLILAWAVLVLGAGKCPQGMYRNYKTGKCLQCSDICRNGKGGGKICRVKCSGYEKFAPAHNDKTLNLAVDHSYSMCPPGSYYDINLSGCDSCSSICQFHKIQETTNDCAKHCPEEYEKTSNKDGTPKAMTAEIVIPVAGVIAIVAIVVSLVYVCRKSKPTQNQQPSTTTEPEVSPLFPEPSSTTVSAESTSEDKQSPDEEAMGHPDLPIGVRYEMMESY